MTLDELIKSKRIREQDVTDTDIDALLEKAESDLTTAEKIFSESVTWAYAIGYNAVLQASRAFVFARGYRPASSEAHKNTFLFLRAVLGPELEPLVTYFDRVRVKRHQTVYDVKTDITETEATGLLSKADDFVSLLRGEIKKSRQARKDKTTKNK